MSRAVRKSEEFLADLDAQFRWYEGQAGWDFDWRYLLAVDAALGRLVEQPELGWRRNFTHPELRNLPCWVVARPLNQAWLKLPASQTPT